MNESQFDIVDAAKSLSRNPLGIIALFIVLVYGFAALVTAFASSFSHEERLPLVYFLVVFPIVVLIIFAWLVSRHSGKLFSPQDFKNEDNYVKMQMAAVASLATAAAKDGGTNIENMVRVVQEAAPQRQVVSNSRRSILWVDDRPENNVYERKAFEAVGIVFTLALTTNDALEQMKRQNFAAVISDMGRKEGPREGYTLLDAMRAEGNKTPLFFYTGTQAPEYKQETLKRGGQGCTNNPEELFRIVTKALISGDPNFA